MIIDEQTDTHTVVKISSDMIYSSRRVVLSLRRAIQTDR